MAAWTLKPVHLFARGDGKRASAEVKAAGDDASAGVPPLHLLLQIGDAQTRTVALRLSEHILVGRTSENEPDFAPDFDLTRFGAKECGVSKQHAAVRYQDKEIYLEDLGSTNGTRINGLPITPHTPYRLRNGDEIEFARLRVVFRIVRAPL